MTKLLWPIRKLAGHFVNRIINIQKSWQNYCELCWLVGIHQISSPYPLSHRRIKLELNMKTSQGCLETCWTILVIDLVLYFFTAGKYIVYHWLWSSTLEPKVEWDWQEQKLVLLCVKQGSNEMLELKPLSLRVCGFQWLLWVPFG